MPTQPFFQADYFYDMFRKAWISEEYFPSFQAKLQPIFEEKLVLRVQEKLTEEQFDTIVTLLSDGNFDQFEEKLENYIPNFDEFLEGVYQEFEEEYLANFKNNS